VGGRYSSHKDVGEVSHFQALSTALSATVGTGNIAGVATAISLGGPGALFWMWVTAFIGMATKFTECTLSLKFREVAPDGQVAGGPMYTLLHGLKMTRLAPHSPASP
jgi:AGCS family alanine or glycine:cation symporter